jgi:hypothetical protein
VTAYCGCLGCRDEATTRIHRDGVDMVVCDDHAEDEQATVQEALA